MQDIWQETRGDKGKPIPRFEPVETESNQSLVAAAAYGDTAEKDDHEPAKASDAAARQRIDVDYPLPGVHWWPEGTTAASAELAGWLARNGHVVKREAAELQHIFTEAAVGTNEPEKPGNDSEDLFAELESSGSEEGDNEAEIGLEAYRPAAVAAARVIAAMCRAVQAAGGADAERATAIGTLPTMPAPATETVDRSRVRQGAENYTPDAGVGAVRQQTGKGGGRVHPDAEVHPDAQVAPGAVVEAGARVGSRSTVAEGAKVRAGALIGDNVDIESGAVIGAGCVVSAPGATERTRIGSRTRMDATTVGPGADIGNEVKLGTDDIGPHGDTAESGRNPKRQIEVGAGARIEDRTTVGAGARIGTDARIGRKCRIGRRTRISEQAIFGNGVRIDDRSPDDAEPAIWARAEVGDEVIVTPDGHVKAGESARAGSLVGTRPRAKEDGTREIDVETLIRDARTGCVAHEAPEEPETSQLGKRAKKAPRPPKLIHPTAKVDESATVDWGTIIGRYAKIGPGATVQQGAVVGPMSIVDDGALVEKEAVLGRRVVLRRNAVAGTGAILDDGTKLGEEATVGARTVTGKRVQLQAQVKVGSDCSLGDTTWVGCGSAIGYGSCTGAALRGGGRSRPEARHRVAREGVIIGEHVRISVNTNIGARTAIDDNAELNSRLKTNTYIGHDVRVGAGARVEAPCGNYADIGKGAQCAGEVRPGAGAGAGASIGDGSVVGRHTIIEASTTIEEDAAIGDNNLVGHGAVVGRGSRTGTRTHLHANSQIEQDTTIGDDVTLHQGATITTLKTVPSRSVMAESENSMRAHMRRLAGKALDDTGERVEGASRKRPATVPAPNRRRSRANTR